MTGDCSEEEERIIAESLSVCTKFVALKNKICFIIKKKKKESGDIINVQIATINKSTIAPLQCTHSTHTLIARRTTTKIVNATNLLFTSNASFTITIETVKKKEKEFYMALMQAQTLIHTLVQNIQCSLSDENIFMRIQNKIVWWGIRYI